MCERTFNCKKCGEFQGDAGVEEELYITCGVCETKNKVPFKN